MEINDIRDSKNLKLGKIMIVDLGRINTKQCSKDLESDEKRATRSQGRRRRWHQGGEFQVQDLSKDPCSQRDTIGR